MWIIGLEVLQGLEINMGKYLKQLAMNPTLEMAKKIKFLQECIERDNAMLKAGKTHIGEWELEDHLEYLNDKLTIFAEAYDVTYEASKKYKN